MSKRVSLVLPDALFDRLMDISEDADMLISETIRNMIRLGLESMESEEEEEEGGYE